MGSRKPANTGFLTQPQIWCRRKTVDMAADKVCRKLRSWQRKMNAQYSVNIVNNFDLSFLCPIRTKNVNIISDKAGKVAK